MCEGGRVRIGDKKGHEKFWLEGYVEESPKNMGEVNRKIERGGFMGP